MVSRCRRRMSSPTMSITSSWRAPRTRGGHHFDDVPAAPPNGPQRDPPLANTHSLHGGRASVKRPQIHVIGKGIARFHAVYWPAFLLSAGVPLPSKIAVHGYLSVDGRKISKSNKTRSRSTDAEQVVRSQTTTGLRPLKRPRLGDSTLAPSHCRAVGERARISSGGRAQRERADRIAVRRSQTLTRRIAGE